MPKPPEDNILVTTWLSDPSLPIKEIDVSFTFNDDLNFHNRKKLCFSLTKQFLNKTTSMNTSASNTKRFCLRKTLNSFASKETVTYLIKTIFSSSLTGILRSLEFLTAMELMETTFPHSLQAWCSIISEKNKADSLQRNHWKRQRLKL